jgi:hypothetical protein
VIGGAQTAPRPAQRSLHPPRPRAPGAPRRAGPICKGRDRLCGRPPESCVALGGSCPRVLHCCLSRRPDREGGGARTTKRDLISEVQSQRRLPSGGWWGWHRQRGVMPPAGLRGSSSGCALCFLFWVGFRTYRAAISARPLCCATDAAAPARPSSRSSSVGLIARALANARRHGEPQ